MSETPVSPENLNKGSGAGILLLLAIAAGVAYGYYQPKRQAAHRAKVRDYQDWERAARAKYR